MARFGQLKLTSAGVQAQINAQGGDPIRFTKIGIGSGKFAGDSTKLKDLVKTEFLIDIERGYVEDGQYTVLGSFTNENLQTSFAWREIGLFFEGENGDNILYCYSNAGDQYDIIPATTDERYTKTVRIVTAITNAAHVSIVQRPSNVANNLTTKDPGYVLDARQGNVLDSKIVSLINALAVEKARIDVFTTLPEGSTTGDAELADIRVDFEGKIYENAGDAVRGQAKKLSDEIGEIKKFEFDIVDTKKHNFHVGERIDWDSGNALVVSNKYARTGRIINYGGAYIKANKGYAFRVAYHSSGTGDTGDTYIGNNGGYVTEIILPKDISHFILVITKLDETDIVETDFSNLVKIYFSRISSVESKITKSINILGIGNSYTRDSLRWLCKILMECGYDNVIVGHGYWGSSTLAEQYESLSESDENHTIYQYWKYDNAKNAVTTSNVSLDTIISDETWDIVIFQQQSDRAGQYESFVSNAFDINDFVSYIKGAISNESLRIGISSPWSHAEGYSSSAFNELYNGNPSTQYEAIQTVIPQVASHMTQCDFVINSGKAVELGRNNAYLSALGVEMLRSDKNHLAYGIPSFMVGMVHAITLCGVKPNELSWYPTIDDDSEIVTDTTAYLAYLAKHCALQASQSI